MKTFARTQAWGISVDGTMPVNLQDKNSSGFSKWSSAQSNSRDTFVYVNGICTTDDMAKATGRELSDMLKKDIAVVHNPTHSMLVDLAEVKVRCGITASYCCVCATVQHVQAFHAFCFVVVVCGRSPLYCMIRVPVLIREK